MAVRYLYEFIHVIRDKGLQEPRAEYLIVFNVVESFRE